MFVLQRKADLKLMILSRRLKARALKQMKSLALFFQTATVKKYVLKSTEIIISLIKK